MVLHLLRLSKIRSLLSIQQFSICLPDLALDCCHLLSYSYGEENEIAHHLRCVYTK